MQDIADALSTSRITVWKALNNKPGVSEQMRDIIIDKARDMNYPKISSYDNEDGSSSQGEHEMRTVAVVISRPNSSLFWIEIIHQLAKEFSGENINMMYTYIPSTFEADYTLPEMLSNGEVDGIVVMNVYTAEYLNMLSKLPIAKVFLDTVPEVPCYNLNGDVIYLEGHHAIKEITSRLLDRGIRKIGFIGDIEYAQTNMDRYEGFVDAFSDRNLVIPTEYSMTAHLGLNTHYDELSEFLNSLKDAPEAFVCASDFIAHFVHKYYSENHPDMIDKIILTGFDNNPEYTNVAGLITTVDVSTKNIGKRLAGHIVHNMSHLNQGQEVSYIQNKVIYRNI
jgi:LacI family transcriptional regulator